MYIFKLNVLLYKQVIYKYIYIYLYIINNKIVFKKFIYIFNIFFQKYIMTDHKVRMEKI